MKITEKDLKSLLIKFNSIPIRIRMHECLIGNIEIKESKCEFIRKCNKLSIIDNKSNNNIQIDTKPLYKIETNEEYTRICLYLDYNLRVTIEKI